MNVFKQALAKGERQIGLWQALASPYCAEICAGSGFDWLLIDAEHGPNDLPLVLAQLQAMAAGLAEPVVRLPVADAVLIKQYLDIGARSILLPMIETVEQAEEMVRAVRYPPRGTRGIGSAIGRAGSWNRLPDYLQKADEDICLLLQVETLAGLQNLSAIASIEGVDGIFIGPSDLSASLGYLGQPQHPEVQSVIDGSLRDIANEGAAAGILMADPVLAEHYLEIGASFVAVGSDVSILARGADMLAARFGRSTVGSKEPGVY